MAIFDADRIREIFSRITGAKPVYGVNDEVFIRKPKFSQNKDKLAIVSSVLENGRLKLKDYHTGASIGGKMLTYKASRVQHASPEKIEEQHMLPAHTAYPTGLYVRVKNITAFEPEDAEELPGRSHPDPTSVYEIVMIANKRIVIKDVKTFERFHSECAIAGDMSPVSSDEARLYKNGIPLTIQADKRAPTTL